LDYAKAHMNLGSALANLGRIDDAIEEYSATLRLDPDFHGARDALDYAREITSDIAEKK
jgi:tetratricopeptide (TPR) repeat protein